MDYNHGYDANRHRPNSSAGYGHAGASQTGYPQNYPAESQYAQPQYGLSNQAPAGSLPSPHQQVTSMYGQQQQAMAMTRYGQQQQEATALAGYGQQQQATVMAMYGQQQAMATYGRQQQQPQQYAPSLQYQQQYYGQANYEQSHARLAPHLTSMQNGYRSSAQPMVVIPQRRPSQSEASNYAQSPSPQIPPTTSHLHYSPSLQQTSTTYYRPSQQQPQQQMQQQMQQPSHQAQARQPSRPHSSGQWQSYHEQAQQQTQPQYQPQSQPQPNLQHHNYSPVPITRPHPTQQASPVMSSLMAAPRQRAATTVRPTAVVEIPLPSPRSEDKPAQPQQRPASRHVPPTSSLSTLPDTSPVSTPQQAVKKPPTPQSSTVDYQQLLLLLAEDYISAAHGLGSLVAFYRRAEDMERYYNFMATGLSCIEASLTKFRLSPRAEAELILQYCNLLFQETENYDVVDLWLSKGIPLCERNKFLDLKYAMQHLSARALFKTKPKVAVKSLDALIPEVHAYRHVPWIYAMRFLRVSFAVEMWQVGASQSEFTLAMQNLKAVAELAGEENDGAVSLLCATFEALLHLRSMTANCVEEAQRSIAAAKSLQFDAVAKDLKQIWVLLDCLEILSCLMSGKLDLAVSVAQRIAADMDEPENTPSDAESGLLLVPLRRKPDALNECTTDILRHQDGRLHLTFSWLHRRDLWTLCFLLNAIAAEARDYNNPKAETYLRQGLKIMKENFSERDADHDGILPASTSLNAAVDRIDWWLNCRWYIHIYVATSLASRSNWTQAQEYLDLARDCPSVSSINTASLRRKWETYVYGVILQGTGDLTGAYTTFRSKIFSLPPTATGKYDLATDLTILATLNSILIAVDPSFTSEDPVQLHASLGPYITGHPNKSLHGSFDLLKAILNPSSKLIDKKKHIQNCISSARDVNNNQLFAVCFCLMCELFFQGLGGEQAGKSVKTARSMAGRSGMALWRGVAAGLEGGRGSSVAGEGIAGRREEVQKYLSGLPEYVRERFVIDE